MIKPTTINSTIWKRFIELAFGDFSKLIAPNRVVFCEGTPKGREYKNFDSQIYSKIFASKYPDTSFVSIGSCSELEDPNNISIQIISKVLSNSTLIKFVDRDDKSDGEIDDLKKKGLKVLKRRHIECYLYDDEIIEKLCQINGKPEKITECISAKQDELNNSISRGNPSDDIKSASGNIYIKLKSILGLTACGNTNGAFMRDTLAPLITDDTNVYKQLESEIFGSDN